MKVYDKNGKQITIKPNSAYITVGSLNSSGINSNYVEKAEIINGADHQGQGVAIPGSSIGIHKGEGQYGGDILYLELNNEILNYLNKGGNRDEAIKIWGEPIVKEFENWDSTTDRSKEIFGCGLFKVSGNSIKIRFSNKLGSAWATYSTTVPKLAFDGEHPGRAPEKPELEISYSPGSLVLNKNSSVHIHYVDVSGVTDTTGCHPNMGVELKDQLQSILDLAVGDSYSNLLWNWEEKGYILATSPTDIHPGATSGTISDDEKHYYIYLTHKITTTTEDTSRDKVVNQTIHYVYEDNSTAAPDHISAQLTFTQSGKKITTVNAVTGDIVVTYDWNGEWTQTQTFVTVKSPTIKGFHTDRLEVGPYNITVTNDNYDDNLNKVDTVVYKANSTETVSRDKVVNQVIHYVYENGSVAAPDHVSVQLVFTQTGIKDLHTGETVWDGEWTKTQTFVTVKSPTIDGYTADRLDVGPYDITVNNDNFEENLDKEDTVIYKANPSQPSTPNQPSDPTQPTTPVQPTTPSEPIEDEEEFTPPLPEEEPDSEYQYGSDQPEKESNDTVDTVDTVAPHATSDDVKTPEVAPIKATTVSDENQTPETISTETTEVIEKDENEKSLPETGEHNKSEVAALLGALASAVGITGLAGAKRRKKKDE